MPVDIQDLRIDLVSELDDRGVRYAQEKVQAMIDQQVIDYCKKYDIPTEYED